MDKSTEKFRNIFENLTACPGCGAPIDRTNGKIINYCGKCGFPVTESTFLDELAKISYVAKKYPRIVLLIDDNIRELFDKVSEKSGERKLPNPRDVIPTLAKKYNLDICQNSNSSYLAQIAEELHGINMKLEGVAVTQKPAKSDSEKQTPKKRGRPKKNQI